MGVVAVQHGGAGRLPSLGPCGPAAARAHHPIRRHAQGLAWRTAECQFEGGAAPVVLHQGIAWHSLARIFSSREGSSSE